MKTDEELEAFLEQDLSDLDFSQFKPFRFEFENKTARVNMRMPQSQIDAVKAEAKKRGMPYQRLMRELVQRGLEDLKAS
ncbi:CopG family antitoxin [Chelativorans xinjiangense]|uniref:CopG family antitoxin n=1 Tax=Chelativorans xinjiangense TaxID=2681485 RepID=UPI001FE42ED8|nr:CopG family antitoxin [Chelativorans xinjiangense]